MLEGFQSSEFLRYVEGFLELRKLNFRGVKGQFDVKKANFRGLIAETGYLRPIFASGTHVRSIFMEYNIRILS